MGTVGLAGWVPGGSAAARGSPLPEPGCEARFLIFLGQSCLHRSDEPTSDQNEQQGRGTWGYGSRGPALM